jgi:hypothetical protein
MWASERDYSLWERLARLVLLTALLASLVAGGSHAGSRVATAVTPPAGGAVVVPSSYQLTPPWGPGVTHRIMNGYGTGLHVNIAQSTRANDHYALDFDLAAGESVFAVASGTVAYAAPATGGFSSYGNLVVVSHGAFASMYAHLSSIRVAVGQQVGNGTVLGGAGGSGGWAVHLHFAMYQGSKLAGGPYGGVAAVPEPMVSCLKNGSGTCENLITGDRLTRTSGAGTQPPTVPPPAPSTCGSPGVGWVVLYADSGYGGACISLPTGLYGSPASFGTVGNDNVESIAIGPDTVVTACEHDNLGGLCSTLVASTPNLDTTAVGRNRLSSLRVGRRASCPDPAAEQVTVYADTFAGACATRARWASRTTPCPRSRSGPRPAPSSAATPTSRAARMSAGAPSTSPRWGSMTRRRP